MFQAIPGNHSQLAKKGCKPAISIGETVTFKLDVNSSYIF